LEVEYKTADIFELDKISESGSIMIHQHKKKWPVKIKENTYIIYMTWGLRKILSVCPAQVDFMLGLAPSSNHTGQVEILSLF